MASARLIAHTWVTSSVLERLGEGVANSQMVACSNTGSGDTVGHGLLFNPD